MKRCIDQNKLTTAPAASVGDIADISLGLRAMSRLAHQNSRDKGFYEDEPNAGEKLALIHSEISEALEALRTEPTPMSGKIPGFTNELEELADAIIRIGDYAGFRGYGDQLGSAVVAKMLYNAGRPHKHGKKF